MPITIKQNAKKETVITISGKIDEAATERAMQYLRYLQLTDGFKKVTQAQVDELSRDVKRGMARKRRKRLAS